MRKRMSGRVLRTKVAILAAAACLGAALLAPAPASARDGENPAAPSARAGNGSPVGLWLTANGDAVIRIAPCNTAICGDIAGMFLNPGDPTPRDWQGASQCQLTILQATRRSDKNGQSYWGGHIVNPKDGKVYHTLIRISAAHDLLLTGYVGLPIFGITQTWRPYRGAVAANCRLAQKLG